MKIRNKILSGILAIAVIGTFAYAACNTSDAATSEQLVLTPLLPEAESGNGSLANETQTRIGMSLTVSEIALVNYVEYNVSAEALKAYTLTASYAPSYVTIETAVDWSVSFVDPSSEWATGKIATNYITVTPESDGALTATVECLEAFGSDILVTATLRANNQIKADCLCVWIHTDEDDGENSTSGGNSGNSSSSGNSGNSSSSGGSGNYAESDKTDPVYEYEEENEYGGVKITTLTGDSIPEEVDGSPVTVLGEGFASDMTDAHIPSTVHRIENGAFASCDLKSVTGGGMIEYIGENAFSGGSYTSIELTVTPTCYIGSNAFGCLYLQEVTLHGYDFTFLSNIQQLQHCGAPEDCLFNGRTVAQWLRDFGM